MAGVRLGRVLIAAVLAEAIGIAALIALVAVFGPHESRAAQHFAERLGLWEGPISGLVLCVGGGFWVARGLEADQLRNGLALGLAAALVDVALLVGSSTPFQPVFLFSNLGRIVAGGCGGWLASRLHPAGR